MNFLWYLQCGMEYFVLTLSLQMLKLRDRANKAYYLLYLRSCTKTLLCTGNEGMEMDAQRKGR